MKENKKKNRALSFMFSKQILNDKDIQNGGALWWQKIMIEFLIFAGVGRYEKVFEGIKIGKKKPK